MGFILVNYTEYSTFNLQLERWEEAVKDYEVLRKVLPDDNNVAESLFHAQVALKKSRGEDVHNMKFGGEVEEVSGLEQFKIAISVPGMPTIQDQTIMLWLLPMLYVFKNFPVFYWTVLHSTIRLIHAST